MFVRRALTSLFCLSPLLLSGTVAAEGRWYKGDLHAHSTHSDGDSSVADIISKAENVGLDYFVITDHDSSMQGETPHWFDPAYTSDKLILLYGVEWTNWVGHANVWAAAPFDYDPLWVANRDGDPYAAAEAAHRQGALFSINHPTDFTCCAWDEDTGMNDAVEVWNAYHRTLTSDTLATRNFWQSDLLQGRRATGVGGSDMHYLKGLSATVFTVGNPTTWVYAYAPTAAGMLDAIAAGRVSVSYAPTAPRVELWADEDQDGVYEVGMGESVKTGTHKMKVILGEGSGRVERIPLKQSQEFFGIELSPGAIARLERLLPDAACGGRYLVGVFQADQLLSTHRITCGGSILLDINTPTPTYVRVEVMGNTDVSPVNQSVYGNYVALSNPIWVQ